LQGDAPETSLRDLVIALETKRPLLYDCFGTTALRRTTLADANEHRSYKIYESLFIKLYEQCKIRTPEHRFRGNCTWQQRASAREKPQLDVRVVPGRLVGLRQLVGLAPRRQDAEQP
jgi:hypothetical protein